MQMLTIWKRGTILILVGIVTFDLIQLLTGFEEPIPLAPMTAPEFKLPKCESLIYCNDNNIDLNAPGVADPKPPSSFHLCCDAWSEATISLVRCIVVTILQSPICILDCLCGFCCGCTNGCCTDCCLHFFPICTSEECLQPWRCSKHSWLPLTFDY